MAFLEANINMRFEEVTNLLRGINNSNSNNYNNTRGGGDIRISSASGKRRLIYQKETPCQEMPHQEEEEEVDESFLGEEENETETGERSSLLHGHEIRSGSPHSSTHGTAAGTSGGKTGTLTSRILSKSSKIMSHQPSKSSTRDTTQESPREYSELTTTYDYEELKSSTLSTDEEDTSGLGGGTSLALTVMSNLNRATSLQLPEPEPGESRGVLRQTVSDSKEPEWEPDNLKGGSDSQV